MRDEWLTWLEPVRALAAEASLRILEIYTRGFDVTAKDDNSPLTAADLAAHYTLVAGLERLTPDIPVLSEESSAIPCAERSRWRRYWLVDPLDGTKEFIKRNGEFTVNIALIDGHRPVLGVVHVPVGNEVYFAALGHGSWHARAGAAPERIHVQIPCKPEVRVVGSRSHGSDAMDGFINRLGDHAFVACGSSLKFCRVAEGRSDVYPRLGLTSEWDTAAAQCVVEEAGGHVVGLDGEALPYNTKDSLLNPYFIVYGDGSRDWLSYLPEKV